MKIARTLPFYGRHVEWCSPTAPGSLPEGAGKRPPHNVNHPSAGCFVSGRVIFGALCGRGYFAIHRGACETVGLAGDFHRPYETPKILAFTIQRTTLPQLRCAQQLPQRGSRDGCAIQRATQKPQRYGRFSSPLRKLRSFYIPPFIVPVGNREVAGDFHRPYEKAFISPCVVLLSGWGG